MGKGKKSKSSGFVSKGERRNVAKSTLKAMRRDRSPMEREMAKLDAHARGKRAYITIANPNPNQTNKRFIRVLLRELDRAKDAA